jgi:hypothetical protein
VVINGIKEWFGYIPLGYDLKRKLRSCTGIKRKTVLISETVFHANTMNENLYFSLGQHSPP